MVHKWGPNRGISLFHSRPCLRNFCSAVLPCSAQRACLVPWNLEHELAQTHLPSFTLVNRRRLRRTRVQIMSNSWNGETSLLEELAFRALCLQVHVLLGNAQPQLEHAAIVGLCGPQLLLSSVFAPIGTYSPQRRRQWCSWAHGDSTLWRYHDIEEWLEALYILMKRPTRHRNSEGQATSQMSSAV